MKMQIYKTLSCVRVGSTNQTPLCILIIVKNLAVYNAF